MPGYLESKRVSSRTLSCLKPRILFPMATQLSVLTSTFGLHCPGFLRLRVWTDQSSWHHCQPAQS